MPTIPVTGQDAIKSIDLNVKKRFKNIKNMLKTWQE